MLVLVQALGQTRLLVAEPCGWVSHKAADGAEVLRRKSGEEVTRHREEKAEAEREAQRARKLLRKRKEQD